VTSTGRFRGADILLNAGCQPVSQRGHTRPDIEIGFSAPAQSEIVFSFVATDEVLPPDEVALIKAFEARFAAIGEPWLSRFLPERLAAKLRDNGFSMVFHLSPEEANHRYFQNRRDGLNAFPSEQMIRATL
jgi:O-methyltransferase involved in polyketide biosynthesis